MQPSQIVLFFGVVFSAIRMLVGATSIIFLISRGLTITEIGLLKSFQAIIILFFDIPLALLADKYSRKLSVSLSMLFAALWLITTALAWNISLFYIAEFFNALSLSLASGAFLSYLIDTYKRDGYPDIKTCLAKYHKYQLIAMSIAALFGSYLFLATDSKLWYLASFLCLIFLVLFVLFAPKDIYIRNANQNFTVELLTKKTIKVSTYLFNKVPILISFILLISLFYQCIIQFWQPISYDSLNNMSFDLTSSYYLGIIFVLLLAVQSLASYLVEKTGQLDSLIKFVYWTNILMLIAFYFTEKRAILIIPFFILMFFSYKVFYLTALSEIHELIDGNVRASVDSVLSTALRMLIFIVLPLLSVLISKFQFDAILYTYIIMVMIASIAKNWQSKLAKLD